MEEKMRISEYQERIFKRNLDVIKALEQGLTPKEVAKSFHLSLATVYNIRRLASESGSIRCLVPKSKAPRTKPIYDVVITSLIGKVREETGFGAEKIYDYLVDHSAQYSIDPALIPKTRKIHQILKEQGKINPRISKQNIYKPDYYLTRRTDKPNDIVEVDIKSDHYLEKKPVIVHAIIDICSKVTTVNVDHPQTTAAAALNLIDHIYQWGLPSVIKTDNDMIFLGQVEGASFGLFTRLCLLLGSEQIFIPVHSPRWNPFIESFFNTWDREFFNHTHHFGRDALVQGNRGFLIRYHSKRSHQGLKKRAHNPDKIKFPQTFHQQYAQINYPSWYKEELIQLINNSSIPLVKGKVSFIRKLPETGVIRFKGNQFRLPKSFSGMMIKGSIEVDPAKSPFKVKFYYRDHVICQSHYHVQKYDVKSLGKF
jgi:hypothetical protein